MRLTRNEYIDILEKQGKSKQYIQDKLKDIPEEAKSKYKNKKVTLDGITFDSIKEGNRYLELKMLQRAGVISELQLQPKFELLAPYGKIRGINYFADFSYIKDGIRYTEDVKGVRTQVYKNKKKMLLKKFPDLNFIEI